MNSVTFGLFLIIIACVALFSIFLALRLLARAKRPVLPTIPAQRPAEITALNEAVLLVATGGRVLYSNQTAREWFGYLEEEPNLERLARKTRPSDLFLGLCVSEGQARFSLDGRLVEGNSFFISYPVSGGNEKIQSTTAMLVAIRRPQIASVGQEGSAVSDHTLDIFSELSQTISSNLDLDRTLQTILESVERLIPSDFAEVTIWDQDGKNLIPYRFVGIEGVDRRLEEATDRYAPDQGYTGYLLSNRKSLLIADVGAFREARPAIDRKQYPFNSYVGIPLLVGGELVGTLEAASLVKNAFHDDDLQILRILSGPAASSLNNAILFRAEQKRILELSGLAELAHAIGDFREMQDLFQQLVDGILPLIPVKTLGFLIYNSNRHVLEARLPFHGIPSLVELYVVPIHPDTAAEAFWNSQEIIVSEDAREDERLDMMGLSNIAQAAGFLNTVLMPLISGGQSLGYLQVADKLDGSIFDKDDMRLLEIVSAQSAAIIQNAMLVRQSQERAQRSDALRRIASLAGSSATLDEILTFSLRELAQLFRADLGAIILIDENLSELYLHKDSLFTPHPAQGLQLNRISTSDTLFRETITGSRKPLLDQDLEQTAIPPFYQGLVDSLAIKSFVGAPLFVRNQSLGELVLGSGAVGHFDRNDLSLITTTASQLASAVEKASLYNQTDESLRRRVVQLLALTRVSRELNTTLDLPRLLKLVYDEALQTTDADCGTILLFDQDEQGRITQNISFYLGDPVSPRLSAVEKDILNSGQPFIADDIRRLDNFPEPHAGVRAAMIVPIAFQDRIAGLIHLHSKNLNHFDKTGLEIAQSLAVQAAIALGNAQRYQEQVQRTELLNRRVETMTALLETTQYLHTERPLQETLETIAYGIQDATPFDIVLISIYDKRSGNLERVSGAGIPLDAMQDLKSHIQPWESVRQLLLPEYRYNSSYFIPHERTPVLPKEVHTLQIMDDESAETQNSKGLYWHPSDILMVPLYDANERPVGLISVDAPRNRLRPDRPSIEALEIFSSQAALVIENYQKVFELDALATSLQQETQRSQAALQIAQGHLPVLLHKDLEQTVALRQLSQRMDRIQAGLEVSEAASQNVDRSGVLLSLGQQFLTSMEMNTVLIGEMADGGPRILHVLGSCPAGANPQALLGQRNPLRNSLQNGEALYVVNLDENQEWKGSPLLTVLEAKAFICLPIVTGDDDWENGEKERIDAVLLAISQSPLPLITTEDEQVYMLMVRQVAVVLQNLYLQEQTNRRLREMNLLVEFSRQVGTLDIASILRTLIDATLKGIPSAHAGMVAIWSEEQGLLTPRAASGYIDNDKILRIPYQSGEALPGMAFSQGQALRVNEVDFAQHYNLSSDNLLLYRDATAGRLPVSSLIVPIQTVDQRLGVLVLDNFRATAAFTEEDQSLVSALVRQTALTLENVRLYQAAEERAGQLQSLTELAGRISSSLQVDELINTLLDHIGDIVPFDTGTLWLRQGNLITVRSARGFADSEERVGLSVDLEDSLLLREMITTSQPLSVGDVREDVRFPSLLEHQYLSWLGAPLLSKGEVIGVIVLEKIEPHFYRNEHVQAMIALASQAAVTLENARLYEDSVRRAGELDQRSQRLSLLNRLSNALSASLDLKSMVKTTSEEMHKAVHSTRVSVITYDLAGALALQAEDPKRSEALPLAMPPSPLFDRLRESLGVFSSDDVSSEADLESLREFFKARRTGSVLILPLAVSNRMIGVVITHAEKGYRFSHDEVELALTICNQAAVAMQNANLFIETERLFAETQERTAELASLFDLSVNLTQVLDERRLLDITFEQIDRLLEPDRSLLVLMDETGKLVAHTAEKGQRLEGELLESGSSGFCEQVIRTSKPLLAPETHDLAGEDVRVTPDDPYHCWLGVPLVVRGATMGVISIQSLLPNAFGDSHMRLISQIANQLSVALNNAQLFAQVQSYAADLEQRVNDRTEQLAREHNRIQSLHSIIAELSASLDLDMVLNRTLAVINETIGAEHSVIMLNQPDSAYMYLRASLSEYMEPAPKGGCQSGLKRTEGLVGWVISNRQPVLVDDLLEDERWLRRDDSQQHRSLIAVPLIVSEDILGVLMLYHRQVGHFSEDQLDLIQATAKQIAITINNAQLYGLIRDQAERLGDMLRTQHVETSRSQAILEAVADGVLVTDARRVITMFNASAEKLLNLKRADVVGQSLESFIGLFGKAAHSWSETIQIWSTDPGSYSGDTYAEQIDLDDRRVVSVHLSPVRLRNDFLGTVSIFRDITHMIEVDRLKSEFVATVSHELRTPMTSIKGYVEIMLMGAAGQLNPQQAHFLEVVKGNTERLAILVNDLLDVSRIEAGKVTLSFQAVDLIKVADGVITAMTRRMEDEQRPMTIERAWQNDLPMIYGDPERIRQIIDNLIENAYQYTPENGKIIIEMFPVDQVVQINVKDNGIGIKPEEQGRVFERFYRGEDPLVLATSGTGLGLPIVQTLVSMHNGRIWFESNGIPGEGSIFSVSFPIYVPGKVEEA